MFSIQLHKASASIIIIILLLLQEVGNARLGESD